MALSNTQDIIDDIRQGKMVILMDDEDRENEGDIILAADFVTPEAINFMAKYGRGLICLTLTRDRCEQLNLPLMTKANGAQFGTAFTLSIEAATGVTTGISAADRARTVQAAVAPDAKPADIVQPGHIFPIMAQPGGVLVRAGHTEAGCDLTRLAGLTPAAVIVEILNEDGTMARRPQLEVFAAEHGIKIGTIADLIEYRSLNEKTVERVTECTWPTCFGEFQLVTYRDAIDSQLHYALVKGRIDPEQPVVTRVHVADTITDILHGARGNTLSWSLSRAIERIGREESGVIVIVNKQEKPEDMLERLCDFAGQDCGVTRPARNPAGASRTIGLGSQILSDLGAHKLRLLSSPKKYHALSGFKLEVVEYIAE